MLAYDIVCPTYDDVCLFSWQCPGVGIPSHAVGIWAKRFEQRAHAVGLASGEPRWEIWFFCKSYPEKMAMAARLASPY
jgi:hypothetical protein